MDAELEGLICSGPRRGKQFTYALLSSRVVKPLDFSGDAALGELARRFFLSRGPATVYDLAWWAGLTVGDAKRGLEAVKGELEGDGEMYWGRAAPAVRNVLSHVLLLPAFDELMVAYKDRSAILSVEYAKASSYGLKPVIVVNGRIVGIWRRVLGKVELDFFEKAPKNKTEHEVCKIEQFFKNDIS
jgi:winged helix DNA-binding protein